MSETDTADQSHERIVHLEADLIQRDETIRALRRQLDDVTARLEEQAQAAKTERTDLEAALAAAEQRLQHERDRHRAAAEALLADNAALRHWLVESRNTLVLRLAELENERRKVAAMTRFVPKKLAGSVWRRIKNS